jgi:hypothetical protein
MHELLVIAPECLMLPCISDNCLLSSLTDKVDIIMPELVLRGFIVCLNTVGAQGDFRGDDDLSLVYQEERHLPCGPTG